MSNIAVVVGTRPEVIKMAPVIREFKKRKIDFAFIHTGQHYDYEMSKIFIEELKLPKPDWSFMLKNRKPASQIGEMMTKLEKVLIEINPIFLLIQGDTNTMLAAALTGVKMGIPIGHIEAGLRSYDWRMPEEHNRRMVDHVSEILFAPTEKARKNLENEHVYGKIFVTGNTVIDAVLQHIEIAEKSSRIMSKIPFKEYILITAHRAENVDDPKVLKNFVEAFIELPIPAVYPMHPRTMRRLKENNLYNKLSSSDKILLLPPVGYLDMLVLMKNCKLILTDSGGLQEEATAPSIRKPVLVLRQSTERPEAVEAGFAKIVGTKKMEILKEVGKTLNSNLKLPSTSPFGDGKASERIVNILIKELNLY